tara:strand:+ start:2062 stop:3315 length:1254 start_codon:yes stop_codon:yes gene_type:complete
MKKNINQIFGNEAYIKIYFLPWLIVLSFILRIVTVYFFRDIHIDNEWNILLDNLIKYKTYSLYVFDGVPVPSVLLPPTYPFFLYLVKITTSLTDYNFLYLIFLIQILLSTYSVFLFYEINQNFFSKKFSLINSFIFSIVPLNIYSCGQISSINLQIVFSLLFLSFLFKITKDQKNKNILIFSLISGLLILTRGEFILIFFLIILFVTLSKKLNLGNLLKIISIVLLIISPYLVRNYIHFNQVFLVKSVGYNLWKGNNELSNVDGFENYKNSKFEKINSEIEKLKKNKYYEINKDNIFLREAIYNLNKDKLKYAELYIKKFFSFYFIDVNSKYPNYYNFFHIFPLIILSILSFPGLFIFLKKKRFENQCLGIYLFFNLLIFSVFFIIPRYKLIILPIQIILAVYFILYVLDMLKKKNV